LPRFTDSDEEKRDIQEYDPIFTIEMRYNPMDGDLEIEKEPVPWEGIQDNLLNFDL
jgi:dynein heavy chain